MSVEELLMPRYKLTTDYPGRPKTTPVGFIFIASEDEVEKHFSKYPAIFKRLHWPEEREANELPEYIRFYEPLPEKYSIWKVNEWRFGLKRPLVKTDCDIVWRELSIGDLPATLAEYTDYLTQINKK